jgi:hypothetical protein
MRALDFILLDNATKVDNTERLYLCFQSLGINFDESESREMLQYMQ